LANAIGWCDVTVNPIVGCLNNCDGGKWCYARAQAKRQKHNCRACYDFRPHLHAERLPLLNRGNGKRVFIDSMSDLWSDGVKQEWRSRVFAACCNPTNRYLMLTKRPDQVTAEDVAHLHSEQFWFGVSVTGPEDLWRAEVVQFLGRLFVSFEPLLSEIPVLCAASMTGSIAWAIIGPQTGRGAKGCEREWVEDLAATFRMNGVAVWLKDGCFDLWPDMERVQQLPRGMPGATG
jgi:protein gp37